MAKVEAKESRQRLVKSTHPTRPDWSYVIIEPEQRVINQLKKAQALAETCEKPCTKIITLLPRTNVPVGTGVGYQMINVDGFRWINAYIISDRLNSTTQRGFSLELSFSLNPFVAGVGVVGECNYFFNFDSYYDPGAASHRTIQCETSDLTSLGGLPRIGGVDFSHILRTPVMGPYVRASAFNEDRTARNVEVKAYLMT